MANLVAIVGRPNVGKSTLFNRLIEQRKAITDNASGVTRDRHYGVAQWAVHIFTVIDTGGYVVGSDDVFEKAIRQQVNIALEEAGVILFMVDCKDGLTDLDKDFAQVLRNAKKPVYLVANKADNATRALTVSEFYALGLGTPYPIAAADGMGTGELLDAVVSNFSIKKDAEGDPLPKIAIIGRPNVGKSSFLNALVGEDRSIVTDVAGTTRDVIDTHYNLFGKQFIISDTAGVRKKTSVKEDIEFYSVIRAVRALEDADVCLLMLDATEGLAKQDVHLLSLAQRYGKGMVILVNKWDLIDKTQLSVEAYRKQLKEKLAPLDFIPILFIATIKKQRIFQAIEKALEVYGHRQQKLATSALNDAMLPVIEKYPPPAVKGKYIKIKYVTQLPTVVTSIAFFCNLPQYIKPPYKAYLENQLRKHFPLEGVPVRLFLRKK